MFEPTQPPCDRPPLMNSSRTTDGVLLGGAAGRAPSGAATRRPRPARPRHRSADVGEDGFTLVELLVVVLMLATLIGIAVPTFVSQRDNAFGAAVQSDLRSAAIALESYRAQNAAYATAAIDTEQWGYVRSPDVVTVASVPDGDSYCVVGWYEPITYDAQGVPVVRGTEPTDIAEKAEWAITEDGLVSLAETDKPAACP